MFDKAFPTTDADNSRKLTEELTLYIEKNNDIFRVLTRADNGNTMYKLKNLFYSMVFNEDTAINPHGANTEFVYKKYCDEATNHFVEKI